MNILGINAFHGDSSAAIVIDGQLIAAVEEERFNRAKHWAGFPAESIRYCLREAGIHARDLDHVALSFNPKANLAKKALFTLANRPSIKSVLDRLQRQGKSLGIRGELAKACETNEDSVRAQIHNVEHHDAHIASGFFLSPFETAAVLSIDGMGDFVSTVQAIGEVTSYRKLNEVFYPHSLGFLYNAITLYMGFHNYGDEYKVMGLAPYGQPVYLEEFRKMIFPKGDTFELNLDYFRHSKDGISMAWENGAPKVEPFHSELLEKRLGPALEARATMGEREQNIAASVQRVTEEIIFHLLNQLHKKTKSENVVLVGGCAMNSVANGKITSNTPFKNAYIPAGAADNGTSFGAAFSIWNDVLKQPRSFVQEHAYWGPSFTNDQCKTATAKFPVSVTELSDDLLFDKTVDALCDGKVIGWFQGRMEFGARALGCRSLIADPRRTDMRDIINLKIKFREKFRPFAPSILEEVVSDWFELNEPSPYMEKVFPIRTEKRALIPAVTHVDGSGRLQSVSRKTNPRYHELIRRFGERTGVPIILNTSLNENEPIVHTPEQAIDCFLRTKMDAIVCESLWIERQS
ncbi:MAG: carbamoyltransferase C-terminal domain-containing protein [Verrucomicrobiota bacterium]